MSKKIRIGMAGCGVVGGGVIELLSRNAALIERRLGTVPEVTRIAVRHPDRVRNLPGAARPATFVSDPLALVDDPDVDLVVEVMGGMEPAGTLLRRSLEAGKPVVTANKALLAEQGTALLDLAEQRHTDLYFEAAVAGGIPIIRVLREGLAADRVLRLRGIINGTSNYILSRMSREGMSFAEALSAAQAAGFAEADPTLDVEGGDAAHKLAILASLAFGVHVDLTRIPTVGITDISAGDHDIAQAFGYVIKHLARAAISDSGQLELSVEPMLVAKDSGLASIHGAMNAIELESLGLGRSLLAGPGAGSLPTAMSVVSDVIDISRNLRAGAQGRVPPRGHPLGTLKAASIARRDETWARTYLRFEVEDRPGVLGFLATRLGDESVSIERMVQRRGAGDPDHRASVVMLTHRSNLGAVARALRAIGERKDLVFSAKALSIESSDSP